MQRKCRMTGVTSYWNSPLHKRLGVIYLMHLGIFPSTVCYFVMHESDRDANLTFTNTEKHTLHIGCLQTPNSGCNNCVWWHQYCAYMNQSHEFSCCYWISTIWHVKMCADTLKNNLTGAYSQHWHTPSPHSQRSIYFYKVTLFDI